MATCRSPLRASLAIAAALAVSPAFAGGIAATANVQRPPAGARAHARAALRHFNFSAAALQDVVRARLAAGPAQLVPRGWEPAATSSRLEEPRQTSLDLGLRREFSGRQSAQVGARIMVLDCVSIDNSGRFALSGHGKVHGLIGITYRY